ncbi:MAG: recombinase A [Pseudomonadota bacterium]
MSQALALRLVDATRLVPASAPRFALDELCGRAVEIVAKAASAPLTQALALVREAQLAGEPAAWVTLQQQAFFAPDAAAGGVDLRALPVVRVRSAQQAGRAADKLLRSGAFGLVVVDLAGVGGGDGEASGSASRERLRLDTPLLARLTGLARAHHSALLFVTAAGPGLGSLIALRAESLRWSGEHGPVAELRVTKDRRHGPGWQHRLPCLAPPGLR